MRIEILFFGILTDISGSDRMVLTDILSTDELISKVENNYPEIKKVTYRIAVNKELINENTILKEGDEVALLPPFAGG